MNFKIGEVGQEGIRAGPAASLYILSPDYTQSARQIKT